MSDENLRTMTYHILRYTPDLVRDEWVNVGVILADEGGSRREARLIQDPAEMARVRRLHPGADEDLLRALPADFETRLGAGAAASGALKNDAGSSAVMNDASGAVINDAGGRAAADAYLAKLHDTLSNVLQLSPRRALLAADFEAEMERLYAEHVAPPARGARGWFLENTRAWLRSRLRDVFRRRGVLGKMERSVRIEEFTEPGDPLRLDYGYRYNGTRGFVHAFSMARDASQAKVLAYTAEAIRARLPATEFTAVTETEPSLDNPRHKFAARLFEAQRIAIVPLNGIDKFAEALRPRLN
jgi:hypothetical protein